MKQRPILFSTPMVQAILEGRKTQTRRIVKANLDHDCWIGSEDGPVSAWPEWSQQALKNGELYCGNCGHRALNPVICPYGKPGDILWVRETWCKVIDQDEATPGYLYKADEDPTGQFSGYRWKPSIHMAQSAARIFLRITDIRVERLQDITEEDAMAEGAEERHHRCGGFGYYEAGGEIWDCECQKWNDSPQVMGFKDLWQSINGPDSWQSNPWTWVVSFERIDKLEKSPSLPEISAIPPAEL